MAEYQTFSLRSPDRSTFLADLKAALDSAEIDPYEKSLLRKDEQENDVLDRSLDIVPPGEWWITEPTWDYSTDPPTKTQQGTAGDYLLINAITKDPELVSFIEGFPASDASKQPSEIADAEKIGGGTHRVDQDTIDSPVRTW